VKLAQQDHKDHEDLLEGQDRRVNRVSVDSQVPWDLWANVDLLELLERLAKEARLV